MFDNRLAYFPWPNVPWRGIIRLCHVQYGLGADTKSAVMMRRTPAVSIESFKESKGGTRRSSGKWEKVSHSGDSPTSDVKLVVCCTAGILGSCHSDLKRSSFSPQRSCPLIYRGIQYRASSLHQRDKLVPIPCVAGSPPTRSNSPRIAALPLLPTCKTKGQPPSLEQPIAPSPVLENLGMEYTVKSFRPTPSGLPYAPPAQASS